MLNQTIAIIWLIVMQHYSLNWQVFFWFVDIFLLFMALPSVVLSIKFQNMNTEAVTNTLIS